MPEVNDTLTTKDVAEASVKPARAQRFVSIGPPDRWRVGVGDIVHYVATNRKFSKYDDGETWMPDIRAMIVSGVEIRAGKTLCNGLVLRNGPDDQSLIMNYDKFLVPQDEDDLYKPNTWHWPRE